MPVAASSPAGELFDHEFLRKLEYLKLVARRLLPGAFKGEHRSRKRGSGIEFADYRPYVEGDPLRDVDWAAYLRFDKLLVRLFEEEGDLPIYLFLDASRSMEIGDPMKFDYARKVVAALGAVGLFNLDRISVIAYADGIREQIPKLRGPSQVFRALGFLSKIEPGGETDLGKAIRSFFAAPARRGLVVVVSDFLDAAGPQALDLIGPLRHDLLAVQVWSPLELRPSFASRIEVVDAETGGRVRIEATPALLRRYRDTAESHSQELQAYCRSRGWSYLRAETTTPFEDLILGAFRQGRFLR